MNYWLIKSEPKIYSIDDLKRDRETVWDGVRNYQARNFLRQMQVGDLAFFYHSNIAFPSLVGLVRVVATLADPTQFDPNSRYYDPKSTPEFPRWQTVRVEFVETFPLISRETLKQEFRTEELIVLRQGNRLSVMPVVVEVARQILALANSKIAQS